MSQELHTRPLFGWKPKRGVGVLILACSGRVRVAEHSVKARLLDFNGYSRDFVSRFGAKLRMTVYPKSRCSTKDQALNPHLGEVIVVA